MNWSKMAQQATTHRRMNVATKSKSPSKVRTPEQSASKLIDQRIRELGGWRGETLARMRALILEADPEMAEENLLKAYGRGIFFMRSFMDEVAYNFPSRGGTVVRMVKRLKPVEVGEGS